MVSTTEGTVRVFLNYTKVSKPKFNTAIFGSCFCIRKTNLRTKSEGNILV